MYRKWHVRTNPLSLEEYLRKADPLNVYMAAFYFQINQKFGFDYWQRMQNQFLDFLKVEEPKHDEELWTDLKGVYKDERLIREAEEEAAREEKEFSDVPEYADAHGLEMKPQVDDVDFEDDFDEFNIIDLKPRSHNATRLKDDEISLNLRNKKSCITFNSFVSREIQERGGYEYAAVANEKNGVVLVLNDVKGVPMLDGTNGKNGTNGNATINSKVLCARIEALLNITDDYTVLRISEYKRNNNYVAYIVSLK